MDLLDGFFVWGITFGRNIIGIITRPYETYRRIVEHGNIGELLYIVLLLMAYFSIVAREQFVLHLSATGFSYILVLLTLWLLARAVGGEGRLGSVALAWGYSLIPTLAWFLVTSLLYVFFPPPRTSRPLGMIFSIIYLVFSATLFYWKLTLLYLTLRFGMRLSLQKILVVVGVSLPLLGFYSVLMYRLGIFRIPFL